MRYIFFILMMSVLGLAQDTTSEVVIDNGKKDSIKIFRPTIKDYQYYTQFSERKLFDTTFTIDKSYKFTQYHLQDNFGRVPFDNIGAGFQQLVYRTNSEQDLALLPTRKSFFILGIKDVKYYDVKTPTTAFHYLNGVNNGGKLQTTYTQNIGKNFNFSIEYMGLRSKGFYQRSLAASNHAIFSVHYRSKNNKYEAFGHYIHHSISNEENGGVADLEQFIGGDSRFKNRENLTVNLHRTYSKFFTRRFYISHSLTPFNVEKFPFKVKHTIFHQLNRYNYIQEGSENFYPSALVAGYDTNTEKKSQNLSNTFSLAFDREKFKAEAGVRYQILDYRTGKPIFLNSELLDSKLKENRLGIVGNLSMKLWDRVDLKSSLELSRGKQFGNYINSENNLVFEPIKDYFINAHLNFKSSSPSFNYLLNSSFYEDYNYKNTNFTNQNVLEVGADVRLKWFNSKLFVNYFRIDQMAYFDASGKPRQTKGNINISQIGGEATFSYKKFHLSTQVLWQNILNNKDVLPLPSLIGRANFYYQNKVFKKVAEIQTGVKAYYFSKFASREFFPILNEFILPSNAHSIGGQPILDVYFNFKVKRMMVYAEAQHLNTTFTKNQSYAAPYYPIPDFRLNLGLVWYLFH